MSTSGSPPTLGLAHDPECVHRVRLRELPVPGVLKQALATSASGLRGAEADARTRTGDPFITSEVLYQLSYVGAGRPV